MTEGKQKEQINKYMNRKGHMVKVLNTITDFAKP